MSEITRIGVTQRWSDVVIYRGVAHFVEVAEDASQQTQSQVSQILEQVERRLQSFGSDKTQLIQVLIYLTDLTDAPILNSLWDAWIPQGHAPSRACVQALLAPGYRVEMVFTAAAPNSTSA